MSPSVSLLSAVSLAMHSPPPYIHPPPSPHVVSPGNLANSRHKGDERKNISHTHTHTPPYVYSIYSVQTEKEVVEEYRSAHDEDTHQSFCCDEYNSSDCCFATMTLPDFIVLTFLFIVDFLRSLAFFFCASQVRSVSSHPGPESYLGVIGPDGWGCGGSESPASQVGPCDDGELD